MRLKWKHGSQMEDNKVYGNQISSSFKKRSLLLQYIDTRELQQYVQEVSGLKKHNEKAPFTLRDRSSRISSFCRSRDHDYFIPCAENNKFEVGVIFLNAYIFRKENNVNYFVSVENSPQYSILTPLPPL